MPAMNTFLIIICVLAGIFLLGLWIQFRLKRVEKNLRELGQSYYKKEEVLLDDLKSGRIRQSDYRREHARLVRAMREDSRKFTDN